MASLVTDLVIGVFTLGVGWIVWAALQVSRRQSPAGRFFGLSLVSSATGDLASVGRAVIRLVWVTAFSVYLIAGALWGYGLLIDVGGYWLNSRAIPALVLGILAIDVALLAAPGHHRGIDRMLRTRVVITPSMGRSAAP